MRYTKIGNRQKFCLLLWKNWILQRNHKIQFVLEVTLPALFMMLVVMLRALVWPIMKPSTSYEEVPIDTLQLFYVNHAIGQTLPSMSLVYAPTNPILDQIVGEAASNLGLGYTDVANASELEKVLIKGNYFAGIEFDAALANLNSTQNFHRFKFALRFPSALRTSIYKFQITWVTHKLYPRTLHAGPRNVDHIDGGLPAGYLREGFLPLQHALSMAFLKQVSGVTQLPEVRMRRFPYGPYTYDRLLQGVGNFIPFFIVVSFIYPSILVSKYVTLEKEQQLKEVMKMMGLHNWLHWAAWFIKTFLMFTISAALVTISLTVKWDGKVAVYTHCSWSILFVFLLAYVISFICFCFMVATFFSKASTAGAFTSIAMFIAYVPYMFISDKYDHFTLGTKLGWCLAMNTAISLAFRVFTDFETSGDGMKWKYLFTPASMDDDLTVGAIIVIMLISAVLYMLICLYVEQMCPGPFGVPKKWNFIFTSQFWRGNEKKLTGLVLDDEIKIDGDAFEAEPKGKPVGIRLLALKKKFGEKTVVKGISMKMFENEITVLLGHNGAGKTTTISMLTGMCTPTSGTAIINGIDITTNIESARQSLGICPQHNVLFQDMSVANHLRFFSRLKGLKQQYVEQEVAKYLSMIDLEQKANIVANNLSGGMQRKLSLCCALIGDTKVVLCDEPSSGLDPAARRQLWDLLLSEKTGRTLLLTTHFMDEADVLGDRIAIMCDGELKCYGTSFFLKKKFGSGYRLICVMQENCDSVAVTNLLRKYVPDIEPDTDIGSELSYKLPDEYLHIFQDLFRDLENNLEELRLTGYGVGVTPMEEVFMKMGSGEILAARRSRRKSSTSEFLEITGSHHVFSKDIDLLKGFRLCLSQWQAMFLKKILYTWRKKLLFVWQMTVPILFVILIVLAGRKGLSDEPPRMTFSLAQYPKLVTVLTTDDSVSPVSLEGKIAREYKSVATSYGPERTFQSTGNKNFDAYILGLGQKMQVTINKRYLCGATISNGKITAWLNNQPYHTAPLTVNLVHNAMARALIDPRAEIVVTNAPLPFAVETLLHKVRTNRDLGTELASHLCLCMSFITPIYLILVIKERESRAKLLQFIGGICMWTFWLPQLLCDWLTLSLTVLLAVITLACFQQPCFATFAEMARLFLLMFVFSFAVLPLTYLLSFCFTEPATGFTRVALLNMFFGVALFAIVIIMSTPIFKLRRVSDNLNSISQLVPHYSLASGIQRLYMNCKIREVCNKVPEYWRCFLLPKCCPPTGYFAWEKPGVLKELLCMLTTGIVCCLLLFIIEHSRLKRRSFKHKKGMKSNEHAAGKLTENPQSDYDVQNERARVLAMSDVERAEKNLVLDRVTKYYKHYLAVNEISLCVESGECFGLLGVNGAGKTTTFKMMTGDETITYGAAYVKGKNMKTDMKTIYKEFGYCPQFDALLEDFTGREVLKIFGLIRGVPRPVINTVINGLAELFGIRNYLDNQVKTYSGGNKRKLSATIAVLGNPSVIYMDEPTTGIDPAARRQLWNVMITLRDAGKSIVLTSHSMEECEALCTRLAIMVNGEFKCIGSTQHLKNKFSKGIILKLKLSENVTEKYEEQFLADIQALDHLKHVFEFISNTFPHARLQEVHQSILTFNIPLVNSSWSEIFGLMENNRNNLGIEDYSISQTTLEEIFLDFAILQREDPRAKA